MLNLNSGDVLTAKLVEAATTQIVFRCTFNLLNPVSGSVNTITPPQVARVVSNSTTPVTLLTAAGALRVNLVANNIDNIDHTVLLYVGAQLASMFVPVGKTLTINEFGWAVN